jgi:FlaA1/EpsC-like NDP-sugar epimerase
MALQIGIFRFGGFGWASMDSSVEAFFLCFFLYYDTIIPPKQVLFFWFYYSIIGKQTLPERNYMPQVKPEVESFARIKVVGVGGSGKNAVNHMMNSKVKGVEFISVNTDAQDLQGERWEGRGCRVLVWR